MRMSVCELVDSLYIGDFIITECDEYGEETVLYDSRSGQDLPIDLAMCEVKAIWPMEFLINITVK